MIFSGSQFVFGDPKSKRDPKSKAVNVTSKEGMKLGHGLNHLVELFMAENTTATSTLPKFNITPEK